MPPPENLSEPLRKRRERSPVRKLTRILETIGGVLLCVLVASTPWLFGTTEEWSVRLMNLGSYATGAVFLVAAICNRIDSSSERDSARERLTKYLFLALNVAVLAFCLVALLNARATFSVEDRSFTYFENYKRSLPTTYDVDATQTTLFSLCAYFVVFWSVRSWLLARERRLGALEDSSILRSKRFQALAWVLALNGFALAVQGIIQRLSKSSKLLWLRESWFVDPLGCFGPFSYRGNAAEYLNLIWPLAVGFWWVLRRERQKAGFSRLLTDGPELLLIPATLLMIAASLISLSRGGALVAAAILLVICALFSLQRSVSVRKIVGMILFVIIAVVSGSYLSSDLLR